MLDIFKRNHEEGQPADEPQAPQEPEVPVQVQEANETANTQEVPQEPKITEEPQANAEENLTTTLETLKQEESFLLRQKQQLVSIDYLAYLAKANLDVGVEFSLETCMTSM
jgi:hypothetical protein